MGSSWVQALVSSKSRLVVSSHDSWHSLVIISRSNKLIVNWWDLFLFHDTILKKVLFKNLSTFWWGHILSQVYIFQRVTYLGCGNLFWARKSCFLKKQDFFSFFRAVLSIFLRNSSSKLPFEMLRKPCMEMNSKNVCCFSSCFSKKSILVNS